MYFIDVYFESRFISFLHGWSNRVMFESVDPHLHWLVGSHSKWNWQDCQRVRADEALPVKRRDWKRVDFGRSRDLFQSFCTFWGHSVLKKFLLILCSYHGCIDVLFHHVRLASFESTITAIKMLWRIEDFYLLCFVKMQEAPKIYQGTWC